MRAANVLLALATVLLLFVAARMSVPPRPPAASIAAGTLLEELEAADAGCATRCASAPTAPTEKKARPTAREDTPTSWKDMPEPQKRDFLLRNYGPHATSEATPPRAPAPPPPSPAAAADDRHLRVPYAGTGSREPMPAEWKDLPEERKREYLLKNYGPDSSGSNSINGAVSNSSGIRWRRRRRRR